MTMIGKLFLIGREEVGEGFWEQGINSSSSLLDKSFDHRPENLSIKGSAT